jgi:hypothetical protein
MIRTNGTGRGHQLAPRKFYEMDITLVGRPPGIELENRKTLRQGTRLIRGVEPGFPPLPEPPRYVIDRTLGPPPRDLWEDEGYWLTSDRMKAVLENVDREAFAFMKCEVRMRNGEPGPRYWLCDVMRVLDALDESASRPANGAGNAYFPTGGAKLVFNDWMVGSAHVFRMARAEPWVICDQVLRDACRQAGLKGIQFSDVLSC